MTDALNSAEWPNVELSTPPSITDKVQLNRVRKMASRQGLFVHKNNGRCPWADGYGGYMVYQLGVAGAIFGVDDSKRGKRGFIFTATLDDVEAWLKERAQPKHRPSKALENRVRRAAYRAGLRLERTKRRDPRAEDFGLYSLIATDGSTAFGPADLTAIERQVRTEVAA